MTACNSAPLWNAPAALISGGQARRVGLARMLARKPSLVLLDEPFAGLDRQLVRELIDDLVFWAQTIGFSMIAVDHQAEVLKRLCPQQAIVLEQGKIVQRGDLEPALQRSGNAVCWVHCWRRYADDRNTVCSVRSKGVRSYAR